MWVFRERDLGQAGGSYIRSMRRLILLPLLLLAAAPAEASTVYLKCTALINHVDKGPNTPDHTWLTINAGQQFGNVRTITRRGGEKNVRAAQFLSSTNYTLKATENFGSGLGMVRTYSVNRSTGKFTVATVITDRMEGDGKPITDSGTGKKDAPAKVMF